MPITLLKTKLYIPRLRPEIVSRPRLIARVNAGLPGRLTLVSAPAGFGKTTLLSEWVATSKRPVAWLSLDPGDNDPARFWMYLVAAVQTACPEVGAAALAVLQAPSSVPSPLIETVLTDLINDMAESSASCTLVLDDFHVIVEPRIHEALTFLVENLPPGFHLVLSGRADPPWPLARLRARGEMTELRADDLRFSAQEVTTFLNGTMRLGLSPEAVSALAFRTEGWIAGLQLAALAIQARVSQQTRGDIAHERSVSEFIAAFTGSHHYILDYLVEEVLDQQPPVLQDFLLKTSILERLTAPLCDMLTDAHDGQLTLAEFDRVNLFVIPLDDQRRWYRYHHLFADLLRRRLEYTYPDLVSTLHLRASQWYERNDLIAEAVGHALTIGDVERAAQLVEGNALAIMDRGELTTLIRWLEALPDEVIRSRPWLCVAYSWALAYAGQLDAIESYLQNAMAPISERESLGRDAAATDRHIRGHVAAVRAYLLGLSGSLTQVMELAEEALIHLPQDDTATRGFIAALLGAARRLCGDLKGAAQAFHEAVTASRAAGHSHVAVNVLCELAALQIVQGQLHSAAASCGDALQIGEIRRGGQRLPIIGYAHARLAGVLREWNRLDEALSHARESIELCRRWGQVDTLISGYVNLARTLQAAGDAGGAMDAIEEAAQVASSLSPWYETMMETYRVRLKLAHGDVGGAVDWAERSRLTASDNVDFRREADYRLLARILIAQARELPPSSDRRSPLLDDALSLLGSLLRMAEKAGARLFVLDAQVLRAMALQARGHTREALTALEEALSLAEPEDFIRIFVDEGEPMAMLLRQVISGGTKTGYATRLLAAFEAERPTRTTTAEASSTLHPPGPLGKRLSDRELEVLRLLTTRLSSTEIAGTLFISPNTARSHIKSIYSKLDVHSRDEAIQRARRLGLLWPAQAGPMD